jgi:segregation and condensation protein B
METANNKTLKLIIEALLFSSDKPLNPGEIRSLLPEETLPNIKKALDELRADYEMLDRSYDIREVSQGYQFRTKAAFGPYIRKMFRQTPSRLSKAAMETLAIIAYKQPILRQEIERLRGVDVGGILRTLMEKGLIKIVGRKNIPGRPLIYGTTKRFLEVFELKDLGSLPKLKEIKAFGSDEETEPTPFEGETTEREANEEDAREDNPGAPSRPDRAPEA